jgi:hypothetical protein
LPFFIDARSVNCETIVWSACCSLALRQLPESTCSNLYSFMTFTVALLATEDFALYVGHPAFPLGRSVGLIKTLVLKPHTRPGGSLDSSSQSLAFSILLAMASTSFSVSSFDMAASTSRPLPIEDISWPSTVTEADLTLCKTAGVVSLVVVTGAVRRGQYSS